MDWFDRKVVEYVVRWSPYGPLHDEDVFPEFGMGVRQLRTRFNAIVAEQTARPTELDEPDRALLGRARVLLRAKHAARTGSGPTNSRLPMRDY